MVKGRPSRPPVVRRVRLGLACVCLVAAWLAVPSGAVPAETRAMWVVRTSLASPAAIARLVAHAHANQFNALLVQVRGRGDAYYRTSLEPRATALGSQLATFDPLGELIGAAHQAKIAVHAWLSLNLVSSAVDLPTSPEHVVNRHPEWLMVPRGLAVEMASISPRSPAYVGMLARWTRGQLNDVEGLFSSPIPAASASHVAGVVTDLVRRYPVDGVHLDYVRYPRDDFDYSATALAEFRSSVLPDLSPGDRERLDARMHADPLVYADTFPVRWAAFRRSRLTSLVMRIRTAIKAQRPAVVLTAAVRPDSVEAASRRLQDWSLWAQTGLLDAVCPMAYTPDVTRFAREVDDAAGAARPAAVWAGIGAFKLTPAQTVGQIQAARRAGASGFVLFSYDSMTEGGQGAADDYLSQVRRAALDVTPRRPDASR